MSTGANSVAVDMDISALSAYVVSALETWLIKVNYQVLLNQTTNQIVNKKT